MCDAAVGVTALLPKPAGVTRLAGSLAFLFHLHLSSGTTQIPALVCQSFLLLSETPLV